MTQLSGYDATNFSVVLTDRRVLFIGTGSRKDQGWTYSRGVINQVRWSSISSVSSSKMGQRRTLKLGIRTPRGDTVLELHAFSGLTGMGAKDPTDDQTQRAFYDNAEAIIGQHAANAGAATATGIEPFVDRDYRRYGGKPVVFEVLGATGGVAAPMPGYAPIYAPVQSPPAAPSKMSGGGIAMLVIGLVVSAIGLFFIVQGAKIHKPPIMAIGGVLAVVAIVLIVISKKLRRPLSG
jgi:hypothetical protein